MKDQITSMEPFDSEMKYGSIQRHETSNSTSTTMPPARKPAWTRRCSSIDVNQTFFGEFNETSAGWIIIFLGFLIALAMGCLVAVIPQIMTQRYAEEVFGNGSLLDDRNPLFCSSCASTVDRPEACIKGSSQAQNAASNFALVKNTLALLLNTVTGNYADSHGRKGIQILLLVFLSLAPIALLAEQVFSSLPPCLFFGVDALTGSIKVFPIAFTQLSDTVAPKHRTLAFGLYNGALLGGFALGPSLATFLGNIQVTILSMLIRILALVIAVLFLPETLTLPSCKNAIPREVEDQIQKESCSGSSLCFLMLRPLCEMKILLRNKSIVLLSIAAFLGKMVFSTYITTFFFYIESNLGATNRDVARMMLVTGALGMVVQVGFFKDLVSFFGEHNLLVVAFFSGFAHSLCYGLAPNLWVIYLGMCISQLTNTNDSLLSSLASRNVDSTKQGSIQGALSALTSLAEAIGPICLGCIYRIWPFFGPGALFVAGAVLYGAGAVVVSRIPVKSEMQNGALYAAIPTLDTSTIVPEES